MTRTLKITATRPSLIAAAMLTALCSMPATAAQTAAEGKGAVATDISRPRDATANQPSESGAQATNPKGAVTGAGQPQAGGQPEQAKEGTAKKRAAKTKKKRRAQTESPR